MSEPTEPRGQLFELKITATGVVHDADGNLVNQELVLESTSVLTEDEAAALPAEMFTHVPPDQVGDTLEGKAPS